MRRRDLLVGAAAIGLAPASARAATTGPGNPVFDCGVASFDPAGDAVLLWSRVPEPGLEVRWVLGATPDLAEGRRTGTTTSGAHGTCTVDVDGLEPGRPYWYRFDLAGERSVVGRTATLPLDRLSVAIVSCSRFASGRYAVYRALAQHRPDLVLHLGDYVYEDGDGGARPHDPPRRCVTADDYHQRHLQARRDVDAQQLHALHPMVALWDDHDIAGNSWRDGARDHDDATDGPWEQRRAAAMSAHRSWLPSRRRDGAADDDAWRELVISDLATIVVVDSRHAGREEPLGADDVAHLADPDRSMLGDAQRRWLLDHLADRARPWCVVANQVVLSPLRAPARLAPSGLTPGAIRDGDDLVNPDQWDGYPAERERVLDAARGRGGGTIVLSGDLHSSWLFEQPELVELVAPSVTSASIGERLDGTALLEQGARALIPELRYVDLTRHGYVRLTLRPERAHAEWWYVDPDDGAPAPREDLGAAFDWIPDIPSRLERAEPAAADEPMPGPAVDETTPAPTSGDGGDDRSRVGGALAAAAAVAAAAAAAAVALRRRGERGGPTDPAT